MFKNPSFCTIDDVVSLRTPADAENISGLGRGPSRVGGGMNRAPRSQGAPGRLNINRGSANFSPPRMPGREPVGPINRGPQASPNLPRNFPNPNPGPINRGGNVGPRAPRGPNPRNPRAPRGPRDPRHGHHHHHHHGGDYYYGGGYPYYYPMLSELYVVEQQCVFEVYAGQTLSGTYPVTQEGYNAAYMNARQIAGEVLLRCSDQYYSPAVVLQTWANAR